MHRLALLGHPHLPEPAFPDALKKAVMADQSIGLLTWIRLVARSKRRGPAWDGDAGQMNAQSVLQRPQAARQCFKHVRIIANRKQLANLLAQGLVRAALLRNER